MVMKAPDAFIASHGMMVQSAHAPYSLGMHTGRYATWHLRNVDFKCSTAPASPISCSTAGRDSGRNTSKKCFCTAFTSSTSNLHAIELMPLAHVPTRKCIRHMSCCKTQTWGA